VVSYYIIASRTRRFGRSEPCSTRFPTAGPDDAIIEMTASMMTRALAVSGVKANQRRTDPPRAGKLNATGPLMRSIAAAESQGDRSETCGIQKRSR